MELHKIILDHLDFEDLKNISQTSKYLEKISWNNRDNISKITIIKLLTAAQIETFRQSKKIFTNFTFSTNDTSAIFLRNLHAQLSALPSIQLTNVELSEDLISESSIILPTGDIDTISVDLTLMNGNVEISKSKLNNLQSRFPNSNIIVKKIDGTIPLNVNKANTDFLYPSEMDINFLNHGIEFVYAMRQSTYTNIHQIHQDIHNVTKLKYFGPVNPALLHFKNLKEIDIFTFVHSKVWEDIFEANKNSLIKLNIQNVKKSDYIMPCQLKELTVAYSKSSWVCKFIEDQTHLRTLKICRVNITDELLSIMRQNTILNKVHISNCELEVSNVEEMVFPSVSRIKLYECNIDLLNAVLRNSRNLTSLKLSNIQNVPQLKLNSILDNLKEVDITINGFFSRLIAPNLEKCKINENQIMFLTAFERLRHINIVRTDNRFILSREIRDFLKNSQCKTVGFEIDKDLNVFLTTIYYILHYTGSIKHFLISIVGGNYNFVNFHQFIDILMNFPDSKWQRVDYQHYSCGKFSFEVV